MSTSKYKLVRGRLIDKDGFPRRNNLSDMTTEELLLRDTSIRIDMVGANPLLTDAVILMELAKEKLSDYVDNNTDIKNKIK